MKGDWLELKSSLPHWKVSGFKYEGLIADGGSEGFLFQTKSNKEFEIIACCDNWATETEIKNRFQVFYIGIDSKHYKIERDSKQEKQLITILKEAKDRLKGSDYENPALIKVLIQHLESREYLDIKKEMIWPKEPSNEKNKDTSKSDSKTKADNSQSD